MLDFYLQRTQDGAWVLDHSNIEVLKALWAVDKKDIYGTSGDSVESILNEMLASMVNDQMLGDG